MARYFDFPRERIAQRPFQDAIRLAPLSEPAHAVSVFVRRFSDTRSFEWFAWRGATWCYIAYLAVILFARRRRGSGRARTRRDRRRPLILGILLLPLAFVPPDRLTGRAPS